MVIEQGYASEHIYDCCCIGTNNMIWQDIYFLDIWPGAPVGFYFYFGPREVHDSPTITVGLRLVPLSSPSIKIGPSEVNTLPLGVPGSVHY